MVWRTRYLCRPCWIGLYNLSQKKIRSLLVEQRSGKKILKEVRPTNLESFFVFSAPRRSGWALSSSLRAAMEASLSSKKTLLSHKFGWLKNNNENSWPNVKYTCLLYRKYPQTLTYEPAPLSGHFPCLKYPQGMHMACPRLANGAATKGLGFPCLDPLIGSNRGPAPSPVPRGMCLMGRMAQGAPWVIP